MYINYSPHLALPVLVASVPVRAEPWLMQQTLQSVAVEFDLSRRPFFCVEHFSGKSAYSYGCFFILKQKVNLLGFLVISGVFRASHVSQTCHDRAAFPWSHRLAESVLEATWAVLKTLLRICYNSIWLSRSFRNTYATTRLAFAGTESTMFGFAELSRLEVRILL